MINPNQPQQQFSTEKHYKVFLYENSLQPGTETTLKEDKPKSVHRLILDQNGITTFEEFVQQLKTKSIIYGTDFKLFYLDGQNDWVSLGDEEDWKILNSILSYENVIKIVCQNIVPKCENQSSNPHCGFFKKCHAAINQRSGGSCPFGNSRREQGAGGSCPSWSRVGGSCHQKDFCLGNCHQKDLP